MWTSKNMPVSYVEVNLRKEVLISTYLGKCNSRFMLAVSVDAEDDCRMVVTSTVERSLRLVVDCS